MAFLTAALSRAGGRDGNEDYCDFLELKDGACWAVADGLGGHQGGETASRLAVQAVLNSFRADQTLSPKALVRHIRAAENALLARRESQELSEMRTTLVVLLSDRKSVLWAHMGDSRLYCLEGGRVIFQTKDHSIPQKLASAGDISPDDIRNHPDRNRLLQSLGSGADAVPEIIEEAQKLRRGDTFLICSDGFWEYVTESEMEVDLAKVKTPKEWLAKMESRLTDRAPEGNDNYTAIAVFFDASNAPEPPSVPRQIGSAQPKRAAVTLLKRLAIVLGLLIVAAGILAFFVKEPYNLRQRLLQPHSQMKDRVRATLQSKIKEVHRGESIHKACDEASDGDEIHIFPGNYSDAFTVRKKLVIKGVGNDAKSGPTIITIPQGKKIILDGGFGELEDLEIVGQDINEPPLIIKQFEGSINNIAINSPAPCLIEVHTSDLKHIYLSENTLTGQQECICGEGVIRIYDLDPEDTCRLPPEIKLWQQSPTAGTPSPPDSKSASRGQAPKGGTSRKGTKKK